MDLRPIDRRGLTEVIAWTASIVMVSLSLMMGLFKTGEMNPVLLGSLSGLITALMARGAQSASERSARIDLARQLDESAKGWAHRAELAAKRAENSADDKNEPR